jgi:hypothetical protein
MCILERGGKIRTKVVPNRKKGALQAEVRKHVEAGSDPTSTTVQVQQANELIAAFSSVTEPIVLAGDFNANAIFCRYIRRLVLPSIPWIAV